MANFFGFNLGNMGAFPGPGGIGGGHLDGRMFVEQYRCYSMVFSTKDSEEIKHGGKVIMPQSALEKLSRLRVVYPMQFKLSSGGERHTHCGVLEFVAEEGRIYVPHWMMNQLYLKEGDLVTVQNVSLDLAKFSKFQPQTVDFLDITNPKAVLESKLRSFSCLTKNDVIGIEYNEKIYELLVLSTEPAPAVSIVECDMKVDFAAPVGYREPVAEPMDSQSTNKEETDSDLIKEAMKQHQGFMAFSGEGQRLDGKTKNLKAENEPKTITRGIPNYDYKKGKLTFVKAKSLKTESEEPMEDADNGFEAFSGTGQKLRIPKKRSHRQLS